MYAQKPILSLANGRLYQVIVTSLSSCLPCFVFNGCSKLILSLANDRLYQAIVISLSSCVPCFVFDGCSKRILSLANDRLCQANVASLSSCVPSFLFKGLSATHILSFISGENVVSKQFCHWFPIQSSVITYKCLMF